MVGDWYVGKHGLEPSGTQLVWANRAACISMCGDALCSVALSLKLHQLLFNRQVIIPSYPWGYSVSPCKSQQLLGARWIVFITSSSCWLKSLSDVRELFLWRTLASCLRTTLSHCCWGDSWSLLLLDADQDCWLLIMELPTSFCPNAIILTGRVGVGSCHLLWAFPHEQAIQRWHGSLWPVCLVSCTGTSGTGTLII